MRGIADFLSFNGFEWERVVIITQDQKNYKKVASYVIEIVLVQCYLMNSAVPIQHCTCVNERRLLNYYSSEICIKWCGIWMVDPILLVSLCRNS